jgi:hypothetical protein
MTGVIDIETSRVRLGLKPQATVCRPAGTKRSIVFRLFKSSLDLFVPEGQYTIAQLFKVGKIENFDLQQTAIIAV